MRTSAKFHFQISQPTFSLSYIHFASGLLTFSNASEDLKGYNEFCLNIELFFSREHEFLEALRLKTGNVPSNGLIQALLGSVVLTTWDISELHFSNL